ncbi:MAG: DMT family transporter [Rhodoferax sp.]|nr:DMT family transporter [Rhodoferax sp.]
MTGSLASFCLMAIAGRELAGTISTLQILFCRGLIGLLLVSLVILQRRRYALFQTRRLKLHLGRNLFHFVGQYGWFVGIGLLPLAQVFALEFTTPLWTLLISCLVLKESLTLRKVAAILLGSLGVVLMLNLGTTTVSAASLYVVAAAIFYSLAYVATKSLSATEDPLTILFYMCLLQLPVGVLFGVNSFVSPTAMQWCWLSLIGLTALSGHFCITRAMQTTDASVVVTLDFLRLPLIAGVGVLVYRETFNPMLVVGAALMLLGNLANLYKPRLKPWK